MIDGKVEIPDQKRLVARAPHQEGAHVSLEELPAGGYPVLELGHGHGVPGLGARGRGQGRLEDLQRLHPLGPLVLGREEEGESLGAILVGHLKNKEEEPNVYNTIVLILSLLRN